MTTPTPSSKLKKQILKQRGVELQKHTRKPITYDDLPTPYPKTQLMKYIELKHNTKLEDIIFTDTIYALEKKLGIDSTTISKWRKLVSEAREAEFWQQFPTTTPKEVPL